MSQIQNPGGGGSGPSPATTVVSETAFGQSPAVGTGTPYARDDHSHGSPTDPIPAHVAAPDPHPQYLTGAEGDLAYDVNGAASTAVSNHVAQADPHVQYQKESEKGAASGYADLDSGSKVPAAELGTGTPDATNFLRGDRSWAVPPAGVAATTVVSETTAGQSPAVGVLTSYAREDHSHGTPSGGAGSDPAQGSFAPGSFTLPSEKYSLLSRRLILTTTQRVTLEGTACMRIS